MLQKICSTRAFWTTQCPSSRCPPELWTSRGDYCDTFLLLEYCCGTPPSCKSYRVVLGGGLQDFSVSPSPLGFNSVFELGWTGLGLGLGVLGIRFWGQGLTKRTKNNLNKQENKHMCQEALLELKYLLNLMKDEVKASNFFFRVAEIC